jgi:hypothetical protein
VPNLSKRFGRLPWPRGLGRPRVAPSVRSVRGGLTLVIIGLLKRLALIAAAVCAVASCGPSATAYRVGVVKDAGPQMPNEPEPEPTQPPIAPDRPPPSSQPTGPIDPTGDPDGFVCKEAKDCRSGHCVDGICCNSACDGICESCDQPGMGGRCLVVPAGQDPDDECAEEPPSSCGRDGACDGARACRRYPAGSVCVAGSCQVATERSARLCDGQGVCQPETVKSCAPAECIGDACAPPCATDPDCPAGRYCDKGTCRTQSEQGVPCTRDAQCGSGFCTDGVCCSMACKDTCYSCNQPGAVGVCKPVGEGEDPDNECLVQAIGTCGNLGGCNGRGACTKHPIGTFCGYGACMNGTQYGNSICDGKGGCTRGPGKSCGKYACNGNLICWNACANAAQCAAGRKCNIHTCE